MTIYLHKNFEKQYKILPELVKNQFKRRRNLFLEDPFNSILNNDPLRGSYTGYRSFNVTGDIRVIYKDLKEDEYMLVAIGSHSQLYG